MLGRFALRRASYTPKNTSLGTVPNAETNFARGIFFDGSPAPDDVCPMRRPVSSAFIAQRAAHDNLARHIACLFQHIVDP
jgi:hypothetical protein